MYNLIFNKFARPIQFQRARISKLRFPRNERRTKSRLNDSHERKPNNFLEIEISRRSDGSCCTRDRFTCFSRFIHWRGARPYFASLSIKRTEILQSIVPLCPVNCAPAPDPDIVCQVSQSTYYLKREREREREGEVSLAPLASYLSNFS